MANTARSSGPIRILSIDGGGLCDVIPMEILKRLEMRTGKKIHDMFDIICGTSGGGLISISVGMLDLSLATTDGVFDYLAKTTFGGFRGNILVQVVSSFLMGSAVPQKPLHDKIVEFIKNSKAINVGNKNPDDVPMFQGNDVKPKVFVITADDNFKPYVVRNYEDSKDNWTIVEAATATSAASFLFKPVDLTHNLNPTERATVERFVDGGQAHALNPLVLAIAEANRLRSPGGPWENREFGCIVSLGTGMPIKSPGPPSLARKIINAITPNIGELGRVLIGMIQVVTDNSEEVTTFVKSFKELDSKLYLFQIPIPKKYSSGFNAKVVAPLRKLVNEMLDGKKVSVIAGHADQESISDKLDRLVLYLKAEDSKSEK